VRAALWHRLPPQFAEQLEVLARRVGELHFDDGYGDVLRAADALEAIERRGVFFITTAWLGRPGFARRRDVVALAGRGHVIGNHTWTHPDLRKLSPRARRTQLVRAARLLEDLLGTPVARLAWPYGLHDRRLDELAAELGYPAPRGITDAEIFAPRLMEASSIARIPLAEFR
jgi:peptidoglycan/xylan/chitin deacetylase (PgdA/CDA1 family)